MSSRNSDTPLTGRYFRYQVVEADRGMSLERVLRQRLRVSGRGLQRATRRGSVRVNGRKSHARAKVKVGDTIKLEIRKSPARPSDHVDTVIPILWDDGLFCIVDKPDTVATHGTPESLDALLARQLGEETVHPVHRLDRRTSGAIMLARTSWSHGMADPLVRDHKLVRLYRAVVVGAVAEDEGCIDAAIGRDPSHRTRRKVRRDGQAARTRFRVLARSEERSVLEVRLETGRTHQIRVHTSHLGHPIVGDRLYGGPPADRLGLHAASLTFDHPLDGRSHRVRSPVPESLRALANGLAFDDVGSESIDELDQLRDA